MKKCVFSILVLLCAFSALHAQGKLKVAVFVEDVADKGERDIMSDQMVKALTSNGKYLVIDRTSTFLSVISKEQAYQRSGAVSDDEIAELGKQSGVQYVAVIGISEAFGEKYMNARLIDVETAVVRQTANVRTQLRSMTELLDACKAVGDQLCEDTVDEKMEKEAAAAVARAAREAEETAARERREAEELAAREAQFERSETGNFLCRGCRGRSGNLEVAQNDLNAMSWNEAKVRCPQGWRLPTITELNEMYLRRDKVNMGGEVYWSGSDNGSTYAWYEDFSNGQQAYYYKTESYFVRCVRNAN